MQEDEDHVWVIFPELEPVHKIQGSRVAVNEWMDKGIFPPNHQISPNRVAWKLSDIRLFQTTRPAAGEPVPVLWPRRQRIKPIDPAKPTTRYGRPLGSKVITGPDGRRRLVMPEKEGAEGAAA
jgi:predicted DNA-binding transcriptional regulator AlpA